MSNTIAIDIENGEIYKDPHWSSLGIDTFEEPVSVNNTDIVLTILSKYNIQDWKNDYSFEDPTSYVDGFEWSLWLQFKDGTVEKHGGEGSYAEEITPDNFNEFYNELNDFVEERLEE